MDVYTLIETPLFWLALGSAVVVILCVAWEIFHTTEIDYYLPKVEQTRYQAYIKRTRQYRDKEIDEWAYT